MLKFPARPTHMLIDYKMIFDTVEYGPLIRMLDDIGQGRKDIKMTQKLNCNQIMEVRID